MLQICSVNTETENDMGFVFDNWDLKISKMHGYLFLLSSYEIIKWATMLANMKVSRKRKMCQYIKVD